MTRPARIKALIATLLTLAALVVLALSPLTPSLNRLLAEPIELPTEVVEASITEPSGAAYHPTRGTILVVSDEGGLAELGTDGRLIGRFDIPGDLEAVAVHPQAGTVFLASERTATVLEYDLGERRVIRVLELAPFSAPDFSPRTGSNRGLEGLCAVPGSPGTDLLLAAWEADPARILVLDADLSLAATDAARAASARDNRPVHQNVPIRRSFSIGARRLSGLTFDPASRTVLALSARDRTISACSLNGQVLATYRLGLSKPEGLCLLPGGDLVVTQEDEDKIWFYRGFRQILPRPAENPP